ncbi:leucine-rich repeat protein [Winogradskyella sp. F6397]|uniref:Leucine-rich repeat protein n=1 Tax=Winogradskyella marina TaxID=2785530 RepID=A0ABS0ELD7_9FLAO|nr:LamG-like jellyroll fold domain-containing protein [Winogradskyella marina]MBF8151285.1 leucine-rich repeat protein [Winogradskyella marina]
MKQKLLLLFAIVFATSISAQTFSVDGVNYYVISSTTNTVGVTSSSSYVGELVVPSMVQNAGATYTVVSILDAAFQGSTTLTSITIPNTVTEIRNNAFQFCSNLTSVDLGNSITSIGQLSFNACFNLTSVVIPSSVTNIGNNAFEFCTDLTSVTVEWATPLPITSNVFFGVNMETATLYVPIGTEGLYQAAEGWQDFGAVLPPPPATHLNFDGANDYIEIPNESNFDFTNQMTVELWMNSSVMPQQWDALVVKGDDSWRLHLNESGTVNFTASGVVPTQEINSTTSITDGNWHHIAATLGGDSIKIYVDGVLETQASASGIINNNIHTVLIGNNPIYSGRHYTGHMDDIRIWNVTRSAEQINGSKNCELQGTETGLVAYYKFNQGFDGNDNTTITTLTDATANANDGTFTNFALTGTTGNFLAGSPVTTGSIIPSVPEVTTPVNYGEGDTATALVATAGTNGTGLLWYNTETGGTASTEAPTPDTSEAGSTSYWIASTNENGCESERVEIVVTVYGPGPATHLNFDGVDDYVSLANTYTSLTDFTIEAWIKTDKDGIIILSNSGYDSSLLAVSNGKLTYTTGRHGYGGFNLISNENVDDNNWHHVALTTSSISTNGEASLYIDGALDASGTFGIYTVPMGSLTIGSPSTSHFSGSIDELRIWDVVRTATEIDNAKSSEVQCTEAGLVASYQFNKGMHAGENIGINTLTDVSGNGNNGTLNNFALTGSTSNWLAGSPITTLLTPPDADSLVEYVQYDTATALTATVGTNGSGLLWYTTETGGTGEVEAPTPDTSEAGSTSYWVSSINDNGCESERVQIVVTVEEVLSIADNDQMQSIKVFPNPTNGNVSIVIPNAQESKVTVYDINGRLLINKVSTDANFSIDLNQYQSGVYILRININQNETIKQIIKI